MSIGNARTPQHHIDSIAPQNHHPNTHATFTNDTNELNEQQKKT